MIKKNKIPKYLLSIGHEEGKSKAKFFRQIGFNESNMKQFERSLLKIATNNDVSENKISKINIGLLIQLMALLMRPTEKSI